MAEGDINLNPQLLQTPEGVSQINSMFRQLFDLVPGDGETVRIYKGYGSPETVINAGIGSVYLRLDGSTGTTIYMKESGILATGWIAVAQLTTPISLANGGTGQSLSDPGADRILFWDDSASAISFLTVSTGLDLTTTNLTSINTSNVVYLYQAQVNTQGGASGEVTNASLTPITATGLYRYIAIGSGSNYIAYLSSKWKKISGVSTWTVYAQVWTRLGTRSSDCQVDVGGQLGNASSAATAPAWVNFTVDVSGLVNGTVYDVSINGKASSGGGGDCYIGTVIAFGS